jgi:hypothetical protein
MPLPFGVTQWDNAADALGGTSTTPGLTPNPFANTTPQADLNSGYFYDNPAAGMGNVMAGLGMSTNTNNSVYNTLKGLAPGLSWLQYFNDPVGSQDHWMSDLGSYFGNTGSSIPGGFGTFGAGMSSLFGGSASNPLVGDMVDSLSTDAINNIIGQMAASAGFGHVNSRMLEGLKNHLANGLEQFNIMGGPAQIAGQGVSDADQYLAYLQSAGDTAGNFASWLGL